MDADTVEAWRKFLEFVYSILGFWGLLGVVLVILARKFYNEFVQGRELDKLVEEKEKTIQRLAGENREYRILFYKKILNMGDAEIERMIVRNEPRNGAEARRALEGPDDAPGAGPSDGGKKAKAKRGRGA